MPPAQDHIIRFKQSLIEACGKIADEYVEVRAVEGVSYWSERVYAYELYHQLRLQWPGNGSESPSYRINGELPKSRNPVVKLRRTPDLLVHVPEFMEYNLAAIEVKPFEKIERITKDLKTLHDLHFGPGQYKSCYLIVFGGTTLQTLSKFNDVTRDIGFDTAFVTVICHPPVGSPQELQR